VDGPERADALVGTAGTRVALGGCRSQGRRPDGKPFYVHGVYREIVIPDRLVFTWNWEGGPPFGSDTLVTLEFHDAAGGTEIVLTHERFETEQARDEHTKGWHGCLEKLSEFFEANLDGLARLP
jgi:uncharacterized protein YndB with AHSA1/START domain